MRTKRFWMRFLGSQLPVFLLLIFFVIVDDMQTRQRLAATIMVIVEAFLTSELLLVRFEPLRAQERGLVLTEVFKRRVLPWKSIKELRQVVVSPMEQSGEPRYPIKMLLVKTSIALPHIAALQWWKKHGPAKKRMYWDNRQVQAYASWVQNQLQGYTVLWFHKGSKPQKALEEIADSMLFVDDYEESVLRGIAQQDKRLGEQVFESRDLSYPAFFRQQHRKENYDDEEVWFDVVHPV